MRVLQSFALLVCALGFAAAQKLRQEYPWYQTGDEILAELQKLAGDCPGVQMELSTRSAPTTQGTDAQLDVVRISQGGSEGKKKALFVFGEHARELISPESGMSLVRSLCGKGGDTDQDLVKKVLGETTFIIIPNGNPQSRKKVEAGEYCRRTNEDGVDLNRNFGDAHRETDLVGKDDEMNPGAHGFSEPESQIVRDLTNEEKPDIFLSIHSGAYLLGTPYGYTADKKADNEDEMMEVLQPISDRYCDGGCPFGNLAGMIGYKSKGCDIDYVKESLGVPFAFTWEIYAGPDIRKYYNEEAHSRAEGRPMSDDAKTFFWGNGLGLLQTEQKTRLRGQTQVMMPEKDEDPSDCFEQFNPKSQAETQAVAENWAKAFLYLCDEVASRGAAKAKLSAPQQAVIPQTESPMDMAERTLDEAADSYGTNSTAAAPKVKAMSAIDAWSKLESSWAPAPAPALTSYLDSSS